MKEKVPYTFQEIVSYMDSVKAKTACPFCDGSSWSIDCVWDTVNDNIVSEVGALPFGSIPDEDDPSVSKNLQSRGLAVIPFVCNQCGFVRPHSFAMFDDWVSKNRGTQETERTGKEPDV